MTRRSRSARTEMRKPCGVAGSASARSCRVERPSRARRNAEARRSRRDVHSISSSRTAGPCPRSATSAASWALVRTGGEAFDQAARRSSHRQARVSAAARPDGERVVIEETDQLRRESVGSPATRRLSQPPPPGLAATGSDSSVSILSTGRGSPSRLIASRPATTSSSSWPIEQSFEHPRAALVEDPRTPEDRPSQPGWPGSDRPRGPRYPGSIASVVPRSPETLASAWSAATRTGSPGSPRHAIAAAIAVGGPARRPSASRAVGAHGGISIVVDGADQRGSRFLDSRSTEESSGHSSDGRVACLGGPRSGRRTPAGRRSIDA